MWAGNRTRLLGLVIAAFGVHFETADLADSFGGALRLLVVFVASPGVTVSPRVQTG